MALPRGIGEGAAGEGGFREHGAVFQPLQGCAAIFAMVSQEVDEYGAQFRGHGVILGIDGGGGCGGDAEGGLPAKGAAVSRVRAPFAGFQAPARHAGREFGDSEAPSGRDPAPL